MRPGVRKVSRRGEHEAHRVQRDAQDEEALVHGEQALVERYDTQPRARGQCRRLRRRWSIRLLSRLHVTDSHSSRGDGHLHVGTVDDGLIVRVLVIEIEVAEVAAHPLLLH